MYIYTHARAHTHTHSDARTFLGVERVELSTPPESFLESLERYLEEDENSPSKDGIEEAKRCVWVYLNVCVCVCVCVCMKTMHTHICACISMCMCVCV
jgi:hypothetical protein